MGGADVVEYVLRDKDVGRRVLLTAEGAARVDFQSGAGKRQRARAVLLPTDPNEVTRLLRTVDALIESGSASRVTFWEPVPEVGDTVVRCRKAGRDRMVRIDRSTERHNYIWEGVRKEIETVGLLGLATAVNAYEEAESRIREGDRDGAIEQYDEATKAFMAWAESRCDRYGWVIFEPKVVLSVQCPTDQNQRIEVHVSPDRVIASALTTPENAVEFLRSAWRECTGGMVLSRSGAAVIVGFAKPVLPVAEPVLPDGWTWGLPVKTIPPELAKRLEAENAWAGGAQRP